MLQIISEASSTILHEFPSLNTIASIDQQKFDTSHGLQIFGTKKLFVSWRTGVSENLISFIRVNKLGSLEVIKKFTIPNLSAIGCPKIDQYGYAIGLSTGEIKMIHCKTQKVELKFNADILDTQNEVKFLDLNNCSEYLSSVYDNGKINVFGLKTRVKLLSIPADQDHVAALARFHPSRKLNLAIGCYSGQIKYYDLVSKKVMYENSDVQNEIVRDICMSTAHSDILLSGGYDNVINIFDLRNKKLAASLPQSHAITSISMSECGSFCCAGDTQGNINCYDFRNPRDILVSKRVQKPNNALRVAFVPTNSKRVSNMNENVCDVKRETMHEPLEQIPENCRQSSSRDSFMSEINNFHSKRNFDYSPESRMSRGTRFSTQSNMSMDLAERRQNLMAMLDTSCDGNNSGDGKKRNFKEANAAEIEPEKENISGNSMVTINRIQKIPQPLKVYNQTSTNHSGSQLQEIDEETEMNNENEDHQPHTSVPKIVTTTDQDEEFEHFAKLPTNQNSTPHTQKLPTNLTAQISSDSVTRQAIKQIIDEKMDSFKEDISKQIQTLEKNFKNELWQNTFKLYNSHFGFLYDTEVCVNEIKEGVALLCQTDPFVNDYVETKEENLKLKEEIELLKKQLGIL